MNKLEQLQVFVQVVEAQSLSKAAQRMDTTVSSISRRLQQLEQRLGVQLLQRTTRRMHLTQSGEAFYQRAQGILADLEDAETLVGQSAQQLSGTLKIAAPMSFGIAHLNTAMLAFMHQHPNISVHMDMSDRMVDLLAEGYDLGVRIGQLQDSSLVAVPISHADLVLCASPEFLHKHGPINQLQDLAHLPALCYSHLSPANHWRLVNPQGQTELVKVPVKFLCSSGEAIREAAIAGVGCAYQPSFIVHRAIEQGLLVPLLPEYRPKHITIYSIYPQTRYLPIRVRTFIDFLKGYFGQQPYWQNCIEGAKAE